MIKSRHAILALLTALNLVNYLDRFLVVAVAPRIQDELHVSDGQMGWITSAFMIGYLLTSPLFAWLGDRVPRKWLIALGVLVWSGATALSGLAGTFASIIFARAFVGVGEASYATLSPTIIDDIAPADRKSKWLGVFYVAIPVGSALGFLLGGQLERAYGWRSAFFIAGGPGVLLALLSLFIEEPARAQPAADAPQKTGSYLELYPEVLYRDLVLGYIAQTFALGGFTAWAASFLYRRLCLELHEGDFYFGLITVVTGIVGTGFGGWLADKWPGEDRVRVALRVCALSSAVAAPLALVAVLMPTAAGFLTMMGLCEIALFASVAPTNAAVLASVRPELRARAMAASILAIHIVGDVPSPIIVGMIADSFHDSTAKCSGGYGLRNGTLLLPLAIAVSAVFWWRGSRPAARQSPR